MTPEEKQLLNKLLLKTATESEPKSGDEPEGRPAGFIPLACLKSFYKLTRTPFIELIMYREVGPGEIEYLYQDRHDQWWDGFCAFGGMVRANSPATPIEVAEKLINREFTDSNLRVTTLQVVSFLNWPEHPWCNPLAVVCLITVTGDMPENHDRRWISLKNMPEAMVMNHGKYLHQCEYFLKKGELTFTPSEPYGIPASEECASF